MAVSRRLRFEILRRDDHTCRYCGRSAPDVKLAVDHVKPVALGGIDSPENLVTACVDCNAGKTSIAPGSPLVANVKTDAIRWAKAIEEAAWFRSIDYDVLAVQQDEIDRAWTGWHDTGSGDEIPRPPNWVDTVDRFSSLGLTVEAMIRLIGVTMRNPRVPHEDRWTYFCGCCWRTIDELQESARLIIAKDEATNGA